MNKTWLDILSFLMSFQVTPKKIDRILEAKGRREQQNTHGKSVKYIYSAHLSALLPSRSGPSIR